MNKKVIAGIAVSALLIYLSVRGISFNGVAEGLANVLYGYIVLGVAIMVATQALRSWRWGLILSPMEKIRQGTLFSVSSVGFLAIMAIPARLGELARPYLISNKSHIKISSALGTILVERMLDGISITLLAFLIPLFIPLPPWLIKSAVIFLAVTLAMLSAMFYLILRREKSMRILTPLINRLPARYAERINNIIHQFIDGFAVMTDAGLLIRLMGASILIWMINVVAIYAMINAFGFNLPPVAALVIMIILIIGIAIPTAPGFVGNWHYACILALGLFGIGKTAAFAFAVVYHFLAVAIVIILGLIFLPFNKFSLADLKHRI